MIHSARPIVTLVANFVFCCFVFLDLKSGDEWTTYVKTMIPTGRDFGLAEWIKSVIEVRKEGKLEYRTKLVYSLPKKVSKFMKNKSGE